MLARVVGRHGLLVLRQAGVEVTGEFAQSRLSLAHAQVARLLQGGEGVIDAGDGLFVGVDVEVSDGVVDELEIESERLESELEVLKERLADLEAQGLEGDEMTRREREMDDSTMWVSLLIPEKLGMGCTDYDSLRLKIFRSLGIDIEPDEAGNFNRAVIRNSRKGDVHVVNIDSKFSRFFYANYFWSTMQG